jgi:hypothetical protein
MKSFTTTLLSFASCAVALVPSPPLHERAAEAADPCNFAAYSTLMFNDSMSAFQAAKSVKTPSCFDWSDDGCSCSPDDVGDFDFLQACQRHDFGYRNGKKLGIFNTTVENRVDSNLKNDLYDVCKKFSRYRGLECDLIANIYVAAVRKYGKRKRDEAEMRLQKRECDLLDAIEGIF